MDYFRNIPTVSYVTDSFGTVSARNLFDRVNILSDVGEEYIQYTRFNDDENLHTICEKFYGNTDLWWLIAILNEIRDPWFDVPTNDITAKEMARYSTEQYIALQPTVKRQELRLDTLGGLYVGATLEAAFDETRIGIVESLNWENHTVIIELITDRPFDSSVVNVILFDPFTIYTLDSVFDISDALSVGATLHSLVVGDEGKVGLITQIKHLGDTDDTSTLSIRLVGESKLPFDDSATLFITQYGTATVSYVTASIQTVESWYDTLSTNYDEISLANDDRRIIKIFNPDAIPQVLSQITKSLNR